MNWSGRTALLAAGPVLSTTAAWFIGNLFEYGGILLLVSLLAWIPNPLGLGMRLLDHDMDDFNDDRLRGVSGLDRAKEYKLLLGSNTVLGRDLRVSVGAWVVAVLLAGLLVGMGS